MTTYPTRKARMVNNRIVFPLPMPRDGITLLQYFAGELESRVRGFAGRLGGGM